MKKGLIIFSNSQFYKILNVNNCNYQIEKKLLLKLGKNYLIDDFSNANLTVKLALNFADVFLKTRTYTKCILALGQADIEKTNLIDFERDYEELITLLLKNNVKPILVTLSLHSIKNEECKNYLNVILNLAKRYNLDCISSNSRLLSSKLKLSN